LERTAKPVEGQNEGQETAAAHAAASTFRGALKALQGSKTINYPATTHRRQRPIISLIRFQQINIIIFQQDFFSCKLS